MKNISITFPFFSIYITFIELWTSLIFSAKNRK